MCIFRTPSMPAQQVPATPTPPLHCPTPTTAPSYGSAVAANNPVMQNVWTHQIQKVVLQRKKVQRLRKHRERHNYGLI